MRVLLFANTDWYIYNFRLGFAEALRQRGHEVILASPRGPHLEHFHRAGLRWVCVHMERAGLNPLVELLTVLRVAMLYRRERPQVVHHFTFKCVAYGSLAARLTRVSGVVNTITGLGHVFASTGRKARLLRPLVVMLYRLALRKGRVIFENPWDLSEFLQLGLAGREKSSVILGVGVDTSRYAPSPEPSGAAVVLLVSRMLWEKGVGYFVEAARELKKRGVPARFVLVGDPDPENPGSIPPDQLRQWAQESVVEWWGHRDDMSAVYRNSTVVCFPSVYREGVPTVLLEAASSGRPIVTTDMPGCREVVRHGENGLLVPPRDPGALAEAIATMLGDPALRARMGARGREIAVQEFSEERVVRETLEVYQELLGSKWPAAACAERS
jgi:glycosyltransferase involved in cell wall biosynthesis